MLLASESSIHAAIIALRTTSLTRHAECSVAAGESCWTRNTGRVSQPAFGVLAVVLLGLIFAPVAWPVR